MSRAHICCLRRFVQADKERVREICTYICYIRLYYIYIYLPWISANFTRMPKKARVLRISIMLLIEYVNLVCNLYNFHEVSPTYRGSHTCLTFTAAYINESWSIWRKRQRHLCSDRQPINSVMQMLLYIIIDDVLQFQKTSGLLTDV